MSTKAAEIERESGGFSLAASPELDGPYDKWLGHEDSFGPIRVRRYEFTGSAEKIERQFRRQPTPAVTESVINLAIRDSEPSQEAIEYSNDQVVEMTHELAELAQAEADRQLL